MHLEPRQPSRLVVFSYENTFDGRPATVWTVQVRDQFGSVFDSRQFVTARGTGVPAKLEEWVDSWGGLPVRDFGDSGPLPAPSGVLTW